MEFFEWGPTEFKTILSEGIIPPRVSTLMPIVSVVNDVNPTYENQQEYQVRLKDRTLTCFEDLEYACLHEPYSKLLRGSYVRFNGSLQGEVFAAGSMQGGMLMGMSGCLLGMSAIVAISIYGQLNNLPQYQTIAAIIPPFTLGVLASKAGSRLFAPSLVLTLNSEESDPQTLEEFLERVDARKTLAKIRNKKIE